MSSIGTTVPQGRNNTLKPSEVSRKDFEKKFHTVFNDAQVEILMALVSSADDSADIDDLVSKVGDLSDALDALTDRVAALEPTPEPDPDPTSDPTSDPTPDPDSSSDTETETPSEGGENNEG